MKKNTTPEQARSHLVRRWRQQVMTAYFARTKGITPQFKDVLMKLATFYGPRGCFPALATLADAARASVKTVQRALAWAASNGLLTWTNSTGRAGNRFVRSSNRYHLHVTEDQQNRAAASWLGRATARALRRFVSPVDRLTNEADRNILERGKYASLKAQRGQAQEPERSVAEMLAHISEWMTETKPA